MAGNKTRSRLIVIGIVAFIGIAMVVSRIHVEADSLFDIEDATHITLTLNGYDDDGEFGQQEKLTINSGTPEYAEVLRSLQDAKYFRTAGSWLWNALGGKEYSSIQGNQGKILNLVVWNDREIVQSAILTSEKEVSCGGALYSVQNEDLSAEGIWPLLSA